MPWPAVTCWPSRTPVRARRSPSRCRSSSGCRPEVDPPPSATLDGEVGRVAARFTVDPVRHEVREARAVVSQALHRFVAVESKDKVEALTRELAGYRGLALVFVRTKRGAARLARTLAARGLRTQALHGDMSQAARQRALARFASGQVRMCKRLDLEREFAEARRRRGSGRPVH